jgi:hypothetical protein
MLHRGRFSLLHQGPLLLDHLLSVGSGEFLEVVALRLWELVSEPEDLGQRVGLALHRNASTPEFLPHGDDHEREQHSVDNSEGGVDEAGHVVVFLADRRGYQTLHQRQTNDRGEASPTNHQNAINHRHRRRTISLSGERLQAEPKIHPGGYRSK